MIPTAPDDRPPAARVYERRVRAQHVAADYIRRVVEPALVSWIAGDDTGTVAADIAQETEKAGALRVNIA